MSKRLADLVLEDTLRPVSEHERIPITNDDMPKSRDRSAIFESRNPSKDRAHRNRSDKK